MNFKALFVEIVRATETLPASLREHADEATALEEHQFGESYIQFLDEQISLNPRGPEWTERLKRRRTALASHCGMTLLRGNVRTEEADYHLEIDPEARAVIHWEYYDLANGA